jgi:hypothetical protein
LVVEEAMRTVTVAVAAVPTFMRLRFRTISQRQQRRRDVLRDVGG